MPFALFYPPVSAGQIPLRVLLAKTIWMHLVGHDYTFPAAFGKHDGVQNTIQVGCFAVQPHFPDDHAESIEPMVTL